MQLQIEDAGDLLRHAIIVFVDADASGPAPFRFTRLDPDHGQGFGSHAVHPAALLAPWDRLYPEMEVLGREEHDGRSLVVVRAVAEGLPAMKLYIDPGDGLLYRTEGRLAAEQMDITVSSTLGDYRDVGGGVLLPFRLEMQHQTSGRVILQVTDAKVNVEFPDEPWYMIDNPNPKLPDW